MKSLVIILAALSTLSGCGYKIGQKEIAILDEKGVWQTNYSCGDYMRVVSEGWSSSTFEVTFTDANGLSHEAYGVRSVGVNDIPKTVPAPMLGFEYYVPGESYYKPDGTLGEEIKEGDIVLRGENKARLVNGKWMPVMIHNPVCEKTQ